MTSVSCTSSVSSQKFSSKSQPDNRSKSCDTNCASNSSCFFKRRKPANPLAYSMRPAYHKTNNSVKQRVMSAKLLKLRQLQSQLNDANFHLAEVARENQTLKTVQKRQDKALSKYENTNADLPRLIHSHEEEIRVLTEKHKNLKKMVKDLAEQVKQRDEELNRTKEQLSRLEKLNKDKHLTEREKLTDQMEDYKIKLKKSEEQIITLNRKLMLESKTCKQRLNGEVIRHKQCQKELLHAFDEIERLTGLLDAKENMIRPRNSKFNTLQPKNSLSTGTLRHYNKPTRNLSNEKLNSQTPVTDVKLEPIAPGKEIGRKHLNGFKAPIENIRQRLSSGSTKSPEDLNSSFNHESRDTSAGSFKNRPNSSLKLEKLPSVLDNQKIKSKVKKNDKERNDDEEEESLDNNELIERYDFERHKVPALCSTNSHEYEDKDEPRQENLTDDSSEGDLLNIIQKMKKNKHDEEKSLMHKRKSSDETSSTESSEREKDIEKLAENLDAAIQRASQNSKEDFDKNLRNYCSDVLSNVNNCSKAIEGHKEQLKHLKEDTDTLLDKLEATEKIENKLKNSFFSMDDDMDLVKEILSEEHKFRTENTIQKSSARDKNSNMVNSESKKKLLATLRAIDNGDSVESMDEPKQGNVIKEIFGNVAH